MDASSVVLSSGSGVGACEARPPRLKAGGGAAVLSCHRKWTLFNGNAFHATQPFSGTRISFIAFTNSSYNKLLPTVSSTLKELGFTAGSSDGVDLPYFKAFRIGMCPLGLFGGRLQ